MCLWATFFESILKISCHDLGVNRITYLSREKPEEEIGVVFLVHSEEARMAANVFRDVPAFDRGQFAGFLYFASLDVWR